MTEVLELTQLINEDRVTEMQIRRSRVEASLDAQGLTALELGDQFGLHENFIRTTLDQRQLLFDRLHCRAPPISRIQKGTKNTRSKTKNKSYPVQGSTSQNLEHRVASEGIWLYFRQLFHIPKTPLKP
ncbi:hypothetical protein D3C78_1106250 [compost metagenome]